MKLTFEEKVIRINAVINQYFAKHPTISQIQAKELMPYFIQENIFQKNNKDGLPIRKVLSELDKSNQLSRIPYVYADRKSKNVNWFFIRELGKNKSFIKKVIETTIQGIEPGGGEVLEDLLEKDLSIVFCGTAVGNTSARENAYYAGPGNKFYITLYEIGLTDKVIVPKQYRILLNYSIGLTDIAKNVSGNDKILSNSDFDVKGLENKIRKYRPGILCFNGKAAASAYYFGTKSRTGDIEYGLQPDTIGETKIFVAPSTSNQASKHWDIGIWCEFVELFKNKGIKKQT